MVFPAQSLLKIGPQSPWGIAAASTLGSCILGGDEKPPLIRPPPPFLGVVKLPRPGRWTYSLLHPP